MNDAQAKALSSLSALIDKIALELVFAESGSDGGLLPINSFINDMDEAAQAFPLPAAALDGIAKARALIDAVFAGPGQFTPEILHQFNGWVPWFQSVLAALLANKTPPEFKIVEAVTIIPQTRPATDSSSAAIHLNVENDREVLTEFVHESREHLQNIESGALHLEENPTSADTLNSIFRAFHTFKGASAFLQLTPMNKLAHELESLLDLARQQRLEITFDIVEIILNGGDTLKRFVDAIEVQLNSRAAVTPILISTDALRDRIGKILATTKGATDDESATHFFRRAVENPQSAICHARSSATVKVDTGKLDVLIDMVGEMIIAQSLVAQDREIKALASSRVTRSLAQLARTTKDLQRTAMSLRMVPIGGVFRKMIRLVRDLSQRGGKLIDLVLLGEETELDRNIVEEIHDPLMHMIRNSVDHGIEQPDARSGNAKPVTGTITLAAFHQGGSVVIQIKDDGAGLNREKILNKAAALGLVESESSGLTDKEIFNFIFAAGFSTAEEITDISGRGVGMDVVRRNIEQLRGKIEIQSTPGEGTTFSIFLPLTLAIIDGLIIRMGQNRYILPTLSVRESFRPTSEMLSTVHSKGELVDVRGRLLPLLRLDEFLDVKADQPDPTQAVLVVIESDGAERGLLVDEVIGKQEVVIKSLGDTFQTNPLLAGAAILGDGRVGLILDAHALVHPQTTTPLSKAA
ncbi:MAG TPA: chemotaxis protein CheA [Verrucomicrobiae bacterium]|nr:chemotaxis protein CheA [Verrucomicrobiae bacterium]